MTRLALLVDDDGLLDLQMTPTLTQTGCPERAPGIACIAARWQTVVIMDALSAEGGLVARSSHGSSGVDGPVAGRMYAMDASHCLWE